MMPDEKKRARAHVHTSTRGVLFKPRQTKRVIFLCCLSLLLLFLPLLGKVFWRDSMNQDLLWANPDRKTDTSLYRQALNLYYEGKLGESIENLRRFVLEHPEDNGARLDLVVLLREAGSLKAAFRHLDLLCRKYPLNPDYKTEWFKTAYLLGESTLTAKQRGIFQKAILNRLASESQNETGELILWQGMTRANALHGKIVKGTEKNRVIQELKKALDAKVKTPLPNYALGLIYLEGKQYKEAEARLRQTLNKDAYFTAALYPLAQAYLGQGKTREAYNTLKKLCRLAPWDLQAAKDLEKLITDYPQLNTEEKAKRAEKIRITKALKVDPFQSNGAVIPEIRVGLGEGLQDLQIKTGGPFVLADSAGAKRITGTADTILSFHHRNGRIEIVRADGEILLNTDTALSLTYEEAQVNHTTTQKSSTTAVFNLQFGQGQYWAGEADRFYRGEIRFIPRKKGITVVNQVNLEEYLYSVLPAEMPASWPPEALRAQAIAARSYALANMGGFETRGFDVMGSVLSAAYKGAKNEHPATNRAVDSTRGQVMIYNGKVISAFFSANSGGHTESEQSVWGTHHPYLQAVPDKLLARKRPYLSPYELDQWIKTPARTYSSNASSSYRWQVLVPSAEIMRRISQKKELGLGKITSITTAGRGVSGRVEKIIITGTTGKYELTGDLNIRNKLGGLRSTLFTVQPQLGKDGLPEYFLFTGAGWGHGVGMCQTGAAGMATAGYHGEEILTHYYSGVEITTLY